MKFGVGAGIGLFLAIIGLKNAGIVVDSPATLVTLGDVASMPVMLAAVGFGIMAILDKRGIPGSIIIGILRALAVHELPQVELFVVFAVMAIVLVFRPEGLFAPAKPRKI